jgi:integrase
MSGGKRQRESSRSEKRSVAQQLLNDRLGDIGKGLPITPTLNKKTLGEGLQSVIDDQDANGRRSVEHTRYRIRLHLLKHLRADRRLATITTNDLNAYAATRKSEGAAAATINQEFAIIKRAFKLAAGEVTVIPRIPMLAVSNVRTGFFERDQFEAVRDALPEELRGIVTLAYWTGWRKSEILSLQWSQVDRAKAVIRLEPGTTKNDEARTLPYSEIPELVAVIDAAWGEHQRLRQQDVLCPHVFHRDGQPVLDLRKVWATACVAAGCPGRIFHDFRRTAVRNLERAGVSRSVAMKITGHKTESVYRRYAIVNEVDLREGLGKLAGAGGEQHGEQARPSPQVKQFKR